MWFWQQTCVKFFHTKHNHRQFPNMKHRPSIRNFLPHVLADLTSPRGGNPFFFFLHQKAIISAFHKASSAIFRMRCTHSATRSVRTRAQLDIWKTKETQLAKMPGILSGLSSIIIRATLQSGWSFQLTRNGASLISPNVTCVLSDYGIAIWFRWRFHFSKLISE